MKTSVLALALVYILFNANAKSYADEHVIDGGFEGQSGPGFSSPWFTKDGAGIDTRNNAQHSGNKSAWIRASTDWHAINQWISVFANKRYKASVWIRTSANMKAGYFSVRAKNGFGVINEVPFAATNGYEFRSFEFNSGNNNSVLLYVGFWGKSEDAWVQIDDVSVSEVGGSGCAAQVKAFNTTCRDSQGFVVTNPGFGTLTTTTCEPTPLDFVTASRNARQKWADTYYLAECSTGYTPCCELAVQGLM